MDDCFSHVTLVLVCSRDSDNSHSLLAWLSCINPLKTQRTARTFPGRGAGQRCAQTTPVRAAGGAEVRNERLGSIPVKPRSFFLISAEGQEEKAVAK